MAEEPDYWFPAKRYGWGWGPPVKWQGWVVMLAFIALILAGCYRFPPTENMPAFAAVVGFGTLAFIAVCWWKGEPPRWRSGEDSK
jgi:hypothetical protein